MRLLDALGHAVERPRERAELVAARDPDPPVELAAADRGRRLGGTLEGDQDHARQEHDRDQQRAREPRDAVGHAGDRGRDRGLGFGVAGGDLIGHQSLDALVEQLVQLVAQRDQGFEALGDPALARDHPRHDRIDRRQGAPGLGHAVRLIGIQAERCEGGQGGLDLRAALAEVHRGGHLRRCGRPRHRDQHRLDAVLGALRDLAFPAIRARAQVGPAQEAHLDRLLGLAQRSREHLKAARRLVLRSHQVVAEPQQRAVLGGDPLEHGQLRLGLRHRPVLAEKGFEVAGVLRDARPVRRVRALQVLDHRQRGADRVDLHLEGRGAARMLDLDDRANRGARLVQPAFDRDRKEGEQQHERDHAGGELRHDAGRMPGPGSCYNHSRATPTTSTLIVLNAQISRRDNSRWRAPGEFPSRFSRRTPETLSRSQGFTGDNPSSIINPAAIVFQVERKPN